MNPSPIQKPGRAQSLNIKLLLSIIAVVGTVMLVFITQVANTLPPPAIAQDTRNTLLAGGLLALLVLSGMLYALMAYFGSRLKGVVEKSHDDLVAVNLALIQQDRQLQAREELLFSMVKAAPDPLVVTAANGCISMASQSALDFYACTEEQLIGRPIVDMYPERMKDLRSVIHQKLITLARSGKDVIKYELMSLTHDKREVPIEVHYTVVDSPEGPLTLAGFRDLRERKQVEDALMQGKAAAEASTHMKSEFLALISHELRTPMAGVMGMLGLALRSDMSKAVRDKVMLAHKNTNSLLSIVNDLLDLAKIEAGKLTLERIDFALKPMLDDAMLLLHERALEKSVHFALHVDPQVPLYLCGDPTRVRQVLFNLVGNAIKFTEQGEVSVSVTTSDPVGGRFQRREGEMVQVRFAVTDTGIGISEEARGRMFQKFEQADTSTTRKFGGTGLGLSICKQIIELMGGEIGVKSTVGQGSTFFFQLDLPVGKKPPDESRYIVAPHDYQLNILVAEDAHTNQLIISALLDEMGHRVSVVANGQLALQALTQDHYDLILMDGRMPVMDGLETTRHIRAGYWGDWVFADRDVPIFALTANASEQDRENFLAAGMDEFLTKPIDEVALHKSLVRIIEHRLANGLPMRPQAVPAAQADALSALDSLMGLDGMADVAPAAIESEAPSAHSKRDAAELAKKLEKERKTEQLRERMLAAFREQAPERLREIQEAIAKNDWNTAAIVVHGIKGSVAYIWPDSRTYHLSAQLEQMADARQTEDFQGGFETLRAELIDQLLLRRNSDLDA